MDFCSNMLALKKWSYSAYLNTLNFPCLLIFLDHRWVELLPPPQPALHVWSSFCLFFLLTGTPKKYSSCRTRFVWSKKVDSGIVTKSNLIIISTLPLLLPFLLPPPSRSLSPASLPPLLCQWVFLTLILPQPCSLPAPSIMLGLSSSLLPRTSALLQVMWLHLLGHLHLVFLLLCLQLLLRNSLGECQFLPSLSSLLQKGNMPGLLLLHPLRPHLHLSLVQQRHIQCVIPFHFHLLHPLLFLHFLHLPTACLQLRDFLIPASLQQLFSAPCCHPSHHPFLSTH